MSLFRASIEGSARSAETFRAWRGAALWGRGFRPFFLAAALWAILAVSLWPLVFSGRIELATAFSTVDWHAHEMIFGYLAAVIAGFLTTAVPNWTGRLPVAGAPLAGLTALWAAGRVAMCESARLGRPLSATIDVAFLFLFAAVVAREVVAGKNWSNAKVVGLVAVLACANLAFHYEDATTGFADHSQRCALAIVVMLILLVGGRVTPSFTNNWLARAGSSKRPAPFARFDAIAMALAALALAAWVLAPYSHATGFLALAAGFGSLGRLSRWRGLAARRDALVFVLHTGFGLAGLGFLVAAASAFMPAVIPYDAVVHTWAVGAAGLMTLAMMTRATLGHSGRALVASPATKATYVLILVALILRLMLPLLPELQTLLLYAAASAWAAAFATFLFGYWALLAHRLRVAPRPSAHGPK
jgi:uncharacterized protein involved in response to NO